MLKKKKQIKQDGKVLSEKKAFYEAFIYWNGENFLTGKKTLLEYLTNSNFAHVLPKGQFRYFKYYPKNIVVLTLDQHTLFDNFIGEKFKIREKEYPEENWDKLFNLVIELQQEYAVWIKENHHTYKL